MSFSPAFLNFLETIILGRLPVLSPITGKEIVSIAADDAVAVADKVNAAKKVQSSWALASFETRKTLLESYAAELKDHADLMAEIIEVDAGKTHKEALGETNSAADVMGKTIADTNLPVVHDMIRAKQREPLGVVGLITSFNFPLVVAHWTLAPALLAGNAVVWKPSEKTALAALFAKQCWDKVAGEYADLWQLAIGSREVGEALVAHESIAMISATGSVAMGEGIRQTLAKKKNNTAPPVLELGGNNAIVIGKAMDEAHLEWAVAAIMQSYLGTTGQRCTNTRRLIVHKDWMENTMFYLERFVSEFISTGMMNDPDNPYGYHVLIDEDAFNRMEDAKRHAVAGGGHMLFGQKLESAPNVFHVQPAIIVMQEHTQAMHTETFAPLLYVVPYTGEIEAAMAMVNAPDNAGLVNGIYTLSQQEADEFIRLNEAGHSVINSPKGTGTPAFGMGFSGNKASGTGEILNMADPLRPFVRPYPIKRVAQYKEVPLQ